ncbi:MAG: hypothetical protein ACLFRX_09540, partial [Gemmatimonadota bacterium]
MGGVVKIGTRGSMLARWQAEHVAERLRALPAGPAVELEYIQTQGDKILDVALSRLPGKAFFTKELEAAILEAVEAEQEARAARRRLEEEREERERALDRLERSLGKIAETRRTALGMVMDLGDSIEFDFDKAELRSQNKELLS